MDTAAVDHSDNCPVSSREKWDAVYQSECPADIIGIRRQVIARVVLPPTGWDAAHNCAAISKPIREQENLV